LKAAGEKEGFEAANDDGFKLGAALGKAGTSPQLDELVLAMKDGEMLKAPVKVGDNWVVLGVKKRYEADLTQFFTQRDRLRDSMLRDRQDQVFEDYVAGVQERMKREGKIKIYEDVLDSLPEEEEPQIPGGLNLPG
jgi:parvulin-like peptidyl-prolyl isomerase